MKIKMIFATLFITLLQSQVCFGGPGFSAARGKNPTPLRLMQKDRERVEKLIHKDLSPVRRQMEKHRQLLRAIERVESDFRTGAVGDNGRALGCLQIHQRMVDDVNRIMKKPVYSYADRLSREKSYAMAGIYLTYYGKGLSVEQKARLWNGGPRGHKKTETVRYAEKVKAAMK